MPTMIFNVPIRYKGAKHPAWSEVEIDSKDVKTVTARVKGLSFIVREDATEIEIPAPEKSVRVKSKKEEG